MVWNNEKDELLCREVLLLEPYQFKVRSRERGNVWKNIADALNRISTENIYFRVDARAVRERCALLINRQIEKEKSEIKQSGISPEETPLDEAIKSIIDRMRECEEEQENQNKENSQKDQKEKKAAEDIRLKAMESLAETKARKRGSLSEDDESPKSSKKRRSSGSDTLQYLREKAESDKELRRQELELQREEVAMRYAQFQHAQQQSQQMMAIMLQLLQNKN